MNRTTIAAVLATAGTVAALAAAAPAQATAGVHARITLAKAPYCLGEAAQADATVTKHVTRLRVGVRIYTATQDPKTGRWAVTHTVVWLKPKTTRAYLGEANYHRPAKGVENLPGIGLPERRNVLVWGQYGSEVVTPVVRYTRDQTWCAGGEG